MLSPEQAKQALQMMDNAQQGATPSPATPPSTAPQPTSTTAPQPTLSPEETGETDETKIMRILHNNSDKNFVQRILKPEGKPTLDLGGGQFATHKMSWAGTDGKPLVYPNVIQDPKTGKLTELSPKDALNHAIKTKQFIEAKNNAEAEWFSSNYKKVWNIEGNKITLKKGLSAGLTPEEARAALAKMDAEESQQFEHQGLPEDIRRAGGVLPYLKKGGEQALSIPLGAAAEAGRISKAIPKGIGTYGLFGLLGKAYDRLPQSIKDIEKDPTNRGRTGRALTDIATLTGATAVTGGLGTEAAAAMGTGKVAGTLIPAAARVAGVAGTTAATAQPGERMSGAISGAAAGLIGEAIPPGLKVGGVGFNKLKKMVGMAKDETPIVTDPKVLGAALDRIKQGEAIGVTGFPAGAITRDPDIQAQEELMLKGKPAEVSAPLKIATENINTQLNQASQKMVDSLGGEAKTDLAMGQDVQNTFRKSDKEARKTIGSLYDSAGDAPGGNINVPSKDILQTADDVKNDFVDVKFSPRVNKILDSLKEKPEEFSVKDANFLTKALNASRTADRANNTAISMLKNKVYETIDNAFKDQTNPAADLFKVARTARKNLGDIFSQKDLVQMITEKKAQFTDYVNPESVANKIFSSTNPLTNLNKVKNALEFNIDAAGKKIANPGGQAVWNNLRRYKFNKFIEDSTNNVNGKPVLSYAKLVRNHKKIGKESMDMILGDKKLSNTFNKLMSVMEFWQNKAPGTINYSNTANVISRLGDKLASLSGIPGTRWFFSMIKSFSEHISDEDWVMKNLKLAQMLKKNPEMIDYVNPIETNPDVSQNLVTQLVRHGIESAPLVSQGLSSNRGDQ